jgi:AcrR family transcriptional regulator
MSVLPEDLGILQARRTFRREADVARQGVVRRTVLESAGPLFAERGFDGAKMTDIAAAAGVSLKGLYGAFASKEDLIEALLELHFEQYVAPLLLEPHDELPEGERVFAFLDGLLAGMDADRAYLALAAQGSAGLPGKMRIEGRDPYAQYVTRVEAHLVSLIQSARLAGLARDLDEHELAVSITASAVALATRAAEADPPRVADVAATLRALYGPHLGPRSQRRGVTKT